MEKPEFNKRTVCFLEAIFCDPQLGESAGEEGTDTEEDRDLMLGQSYVN